MADVPSEGPKNVAKGGLKLLKKIPPLGWVVIAAIMIAVIIYMRHKATVNAANQSDQNAGATQDQGQYDASTYGADTNGLDSAYLSGYDSGIYSQGLPTDIFGGANNGGGTSTGGSTGQTSDPGQQPDPSGAGGGSIVPTPPPDINVTVNTGGGPPSRSTTNHTTPATTTGARPAVGSSVPGKPKGTLVAPYGHNKPPAKPGYDIVGTGGGGWIYVPKPKAGTFKSSKPKRVK